jgi:excisionase family DNA binding protein
MTDTVTPARATLATLPDVCSPEEAAEALGVHVKTVRRACRRGELRAARLGSVWRIRAEDVRRLFDAEPGEPPIALPGRAPRLARSGGRSKRRRRTFRPATVTPSQSSEPQSPA